MAGFFAELKQRKVVRVGIAYAVAGFVVLQAGDLILNGLEAPAIVFKILIALVLLGFPLALGLAWAFDATPDGLQRADSGKGSALRGVALVTIGMVISFVAFAAYDGFERPLERTERIQSIGVLPFDNLGGSKDNEYFSDGVTEELLNALAKVPGLHVASRTSSFQYKGKDTDPVEVGRKLGVRAILDGSIRQSGNQLRIIATLVDASSGREIWSERYDRELSDVFELQDEITRTIVDQLKLELEGNTRLASGPENVEAYKLYLEGNFHFYKYDEPNLRRAAQLYDRALAIDSTYALAWAGLSRTWSFLADEWERPLDAYPRARTAAQRALALDSTLAHAQLALADVAMWHEWNPDRAEALTRKAQQLEPNSAITLLYSSYYERDSTRVAPNVRRAYQLDPLNPMIADEYAQLLRQTAPEQGIQLAQQLVATDPGRARSHSTLGYVLRQAGRRPEAYAAFRRSLELSDTLPTLATPFITMLEQDGQIDELRRLRDRLLARSAQRYIREDVMARLFMVTGDRDRAFEWIDRAIDSRGSAAMALVRVAPTFAALHSDPRWARASARIDALRAR